ALLEQLGSALRICATQRMLYGLDFQLLGPQPAARQPMQFGVRPRALIEQAALQKLGKQMVISIPATLLIQLQQEQPRMLDEVEHSPAVVIAGERVAKGRAEPIQHRSLEHELAHLDGQRGKHFLGKEIRYGAAVAREGCKYLLRRRPLP